MIHQVVIEHYAALHTFSERVKGLVSEGYNVLFRSDGFNDGFLFAKLRHHNGNTITLFGDVKRNVMLQRSNGRVVYDGKLF